MNKKKTRAQCFLPFTFYQYCLPTFRPKSKYICSRSSKIVHRWHRNDGKSPLRNGCFRCATHRTREYTNTFSTYFNISICIYRMCKQLKWFGNIQTNDADGGVSRTCYTIFSRMNFIAVDRGAHTRYQFKRCLKFVWADAKQVCDAGSNPAAFDSRIELNNKPDMRTNNKHIHHSCRSLIWKTSEIYILGCRPSLRSNHFGFSVVNCLLWFFFK